MGKIISVHSYRGGTGKSNLTANLATCVAQRGKRVGIVDTDIQSPGIHVLFGLDDAKIVRALNDYLRGQCAIQDTAYNISLPEVAAQQGALYLIPSSIKPGEIARILREGYDVNLLNDGFADLIEKLNLDYLFIDTHPGLNEETLLSFAISDMVIILLRPDKQDYQGTAVTVEVARKLNVPRMFLIINKALPSADPQALRVQVENSYNLGVAAVFPLTEQMMELGSGGIFCLHYPHHDFTQKVQKLAELLMK